MTQEEKYKIINNDYTDLYIEHNRNEKLLNRFPGATTHIINARYAIAYVPVDILDKNFIRKYGYSTLPRLYGLTSKVALESTRVHRLRAIPGFNLRGKGVLVAIIDTGVDYTNPIFIREDGTSKIIRLWDQTIDSLDHYPKDTFYGTEYSRKQINNAIKSSNPYDIVPSKDEIGHGTMLTGIMAGSEVPSSNFSGVASDADIIVVKLKQAKNNLRDFFFIPYDVPCYQDNDIIWGLEFIIKTANQYNMPCSICIGMGSSQGAHDGRGPLDNEMYFFTIFPHFGFSLSAGNEGNNKRHFFHTTDPSIRYTTVELNIGENEPGFSMELWGGLPNTYSIDMLSPSGEYIPRITESLRFNIEIKFIFEETTIFVDYNLVETNTGDQLILLRFSKPAAGIWRFRVYSRGSEPGSFNIWLPMNGFISNQTYFLNPTPYTTITSPSNTAPPITVTAYNPENDQLYNQASKGFARNGVIKPELTAPGVNLVVPNLSKGFTTASGTGLAAAFTAGITALMLEWGVVNGYYPNISSIQIKKYLIRGARRSRLLHYPNQDWGYGIIDLFNVFNTLRSNFPTKK
ncbi:S8 family peptidase [Anaerosacchariphilus polymeriproducens]|uniref:Peptidase S8/S53 domain-containing protein n=1 Tax=Anaerosacchariphilus polymeriproducens TaxID=1812858 RepID=A0A371AVV6_9FIRM|nr:S8 family peptidase [Anaerosacchariphilus polymeriproducens]RDU23707.1 hypothetical protein DWV06_07550 [Anaerosacchariphilus polymeriproducens]